MHNDESHLFSSRPELLITTSPHVQMREARFSLNLLPPEKVEKRLRGEIRVNLLRKITVK